MRLSPGSSRVAVCDSQDQHSARPLLFLAPIQLETPLTTGRGNYCRNRITQGEIEDCPPTTLLLIKAGGRDRGGAGLYVRDTSGSHPASQQNHMCDQPHVTCPCPFTNSRENRTRLTDSPPLNNLAAHL